MAQKVANQVGSLGVALSPCTVPGNPPSDRLDGAWVEVGMGIHGEEGIQRQEMPPAQAADELTARMLEAILGQPGKDGDARISMPEGGHVVLLVNNLGATPLMELLVVVGAAVRLLAQRGITVVRIITGALMTSLEMAGVSISILKVK